MEKNYDKDIAKLEVKIEHLDKRIDKYEIETNDKLSQIKKQIDENSIKTNSKLDKLHEDLQELKSQADHTKGFIKAFLIFGSLIGFIITVLLKFVG